MKTIAFCIFKYFPYGGKERDFLRIALECQKMGMFIRVYTTKWDGDIPEGFDVRLLNRKGFSNAKRIVNFSKSVQKLLIIDPADVVVGFDKMPGLDVYFAADVCFATKVDSKNVFVKKLPRYKTFLELERSVFNSTTKIMFLLQRQLNDFKNYYDIDDSRIKVLPLALNSEFGKRIKVSREDVRSELGVSETDFLITQIASSFDTKGVDRVIDALAKISSDNVKYLVIGAGDVSKYEKLVKQKKLSSKVIFVGGRSDTAELLSSADILVHPARVENTGLTLLEALAVNLPVVCSGLCGYSPIVEESGGVVLREPFSQEELYTELKRCLDHRVLVDMKTKLKSKVPSLKLSGFTESAAEFIINEICLVTEDTYEN